MSRLINIGPRLQLSSTARQAYDNNDGRLRGRALQARRMRVWSKNPHCAACGALTDIEKRSAIGFQLDHKVPLFKGGPDTDDNCQVLCLACHDGKTAVDMGHRPRVQIDADGWPVTAPAANAHHFGAGKGEGA